MPKPAKTMVRKRKTMANTHGKCPNATQNAPDLGGRISMSVNYSSSHVLAAASNVTVTTTGPGMSSRPSGSRPLCDSDEVVRPDVGSGSVVNLRE